MVQVCVALRRAEARKIVVTCGGWMRRGRSGLGPSLAVAEKGGRSGRQGRRECRVECVPKDEWTRARCGLGLGWWWRDARRDVVSGDAEFAMRGDAELREVCGHGAARSREKVAVRPGSGVIFPGPEEAWQGAAVGVEKAFGALVLGVRSHPAVVARVRGHARER